MLEQRSSMLIRRDQFCLYTTKTCTMYDLKLILKILIRNRLRVSKEDELITHPKDYRLLNNNDKPKVYLVSSLCYPFFFIL